MTTGITIQYIGGPTAFFVYGGLGFLTDPTLDPAGSDYPTPVYTLHKTIGPAGSPPPRSPAPHVLLSHDHHFDNLDRGGREFLAQAAATLTTTVGAERLGGTAHGLSPWEFIELPTPTGATVRVTATPARHGPAGGDRGPVIGFVLTISDDTLPPLYFSGDTVWYEGVEEVGHRFTIGVALLNLGAAMVAVAGPHALTFTGDDAVLLARAWPQAILIPLHYEGWTHFTQGKEQIQLITKEAGVHDHFRWLDSGRMTAI